MSVLARLLQRADDEPIVIEAMRRKHLARHAPDRAGRVPEAVDACSVRE